MTIKEIAKQAGVSIGTVDRVLHNRGRVSDETIGRVRKIVEESGYKPNLLASSLSSSKSFVLGVVMPHPHQDTHFWSIPQQGVLDAASEISTFNINTEFFFFDKYDSRSFRKACHSLLSRDVDGILMAPVLTDQATRFFKEQLPAHIPFILFDSALPEVESLAYIGQDPFQSGIVSARLLSLCANSGELIVVRVIPQDFHILERGRGFVDFFENRYDGPKKFTCHLYDIADSDDSSSFSAIGEQIFKAHGTRLSGIFVTNDSVHRMAEYLEKTGRSGGIPLVGYDLIPHNMEYLSKGTISFLISQHSYQQGYMGIQSLFKALVLREPVKKEIMMPIDIISKENMMYTQNSFRE